MKKLNMTVGRFQPFTQGHLNMVNEGAAPCIIYQITPPEMPKSITDIKIKGKKVKKQQIEHVLAFLNHEEVNLTEDEKEILKRPFTNTLVTKELDIVQKSNPNIVDIVYVKNVFDALDRFNALCTDQADEYEPGLWMCGDDRVDNYSGLIDKYPELETELGNKEIIPNILKGRLKTSTGKGRTEGVSGTAVRASIINDDKQAFTKIMPIGVSKMFDEFKAAFDEYKGVLEGIIKEWKMTNLKDYIYETLTNYIFEATSSEIRQATANLKMKFDVDPLDIYVYLQDEVNLNDTLEEKDKWIDEELNQIIIDIKNNGSDPLDFTRNKDWKTFIKCFKKEYKKESYYELALQMYKKIEEYQ